MRPDWRGPLAGWVVLKAFWFQSEHLLKLAGSCRSVLCARPDGRAPLPGWVVRWASLVLAFVEDEHATLPKLLEGASAFPWFNFVSLLTGMD